MKRLLLMLLVACAPPPPSHQHAGEPATHPRLGQPVICIGNSGCLYVGMVDGGVMAYVGERLPE